MLSNEVFVFLPRLWWCQTFDTYQIRFDACEAIFCCWLFFEISGLGKYLWPIGKHHLNQPVGQRQRFPDRGRQWLNLGLIKIVWEGFALGGTKNTNFQNSMGALSYPISFAIRISKQFLFCESVPKPPKCPFGEISFIFIIAGLEPKIFVFKSSSKQ